MTNELNSEPRDIYEDRQFKRVSAEHRQAVFDEGRCIAAPGEFLTCPEDPSELPLCPGDLLNKGFHVRARRPFFGYIVEIWLRRHSSAPEQFLLRPRSASLLGSAVKSAAFADKTKVIENAGRDVSGAPFHVVRCGRRVFVDAGWYVVGFSRKHALEFADQLHKASVAHLS